MEKINLVPRLKTSIELKNLPVKTILTPNLKNVKLTTVSIVTPKLMFATPVNLDLLYSHGLNPMLLKPLS